MRSFGNFLVKQRAETAKLLLNKFKEENSSIEDLVVFKSLLLNMDYKEIINLAKSQNINKIPCPSNY